MPLVDVILPQMGEGLQEALITALLKAPGDPVEKDEAIFEMETDKATVPVESAYRGRLREWLVKDGDVVAIGAVVGRIEAESTTEKDKKSPVFEPAAPVGASAKPVDFRGSGIKIPPRTRAHCRSLGISEEEMLRIPAPSGKLMPQDVDRYLAETKGAPGALYVERRLSAPQRALDYRLRRSAQLVIPATISCLLPTKALDQAELAQQSALPESPLTRFEVLAYSVAMAARQHPSFRSVLTDRDSVREYAHLNLGIAVHCPGDDLLTAVVRNADALSLAEFVSAVQQQVTLAFKGKDQSDAATQVILTYLADSGIIQAIPVLVAPAIAVLFIGAPHLEVQENLKPALNLTLTFDHRLINGIGAARFLHDVVQEVQRLGSGDSAKPQVALSQPESKESSPLLASLWPASDKDRRILLETHLRSRVAALLGVPEYKVSSRTPLRTLGLKSLMSVQLSQQLAEELALPLPASLVFDYPTLVEIAAFLTEQLSGASVDRSRPVVANGGEEDARMKSQLSGLSDEDAARLLEQKLADIDKRF